MKNKCNNLKQNGYSRVSEQCGTQWLVKLEQLLR